MFDETEGTELEYTTQEVIKKDRFQVAKNVSSSDSGSDSDSDGSDGFYDALENIQYQAFTQATHDQTC